MPITKLKKAIKKEIKNLEIKGILKAPERIITWFVPAQGKLGPRFLLEGQGNKKFLRMNSNNYLGLAQDTRLIDAERTASQLGVNPGGVRFIDGTTKYHRDLEESLASFHNTKAAKIFSCAYMANLGVALALMNKKTYVVSDQLNHNSIARAIRIAGVPSQNKGIYEHNNPQSLEELLKTVPKEIERTIIMFDGVFSMRGDYASIKEIVRLAKKYNKNFKDGVITIIDDSHGIAAYGKTGRGTSEVTKANADIITSTLGKAFGAEGGYVASNEEIIEIIRQRADTYIYTNPISPGAANAGITAVGIVDNTEGKLLLSNLKENSDYFRQGIQDIGFEIIPGIHPIIPVLIRDTKKVKTMVNELYKKGLLVTGLTSPIVPAGDETIRIQISAVHTKTDLNYVLDSFEKVK